VLHPVEVALKAGPHGVGLLRKGPIPGPRGPGRPVSQAGFLQDLALDSGLEAPRERPDCYLTVRVDVCHEDNRIETR